MLEDSPGTAGRRGDERAVSEVLSYSLIFGLIVASIAIVTVGGLGSLQSAQTNEQVSNAERAFDVLYDNLGDIHSNGAPSRATEISLGDSELFFGDNVTMEVELDSGTVIDREIRPVIFRVDEGRKLVYEAGAVMRVNRDGGLVINPPPFTVVEGSGGGSGHVHIPIIQTASPNVQSMGSTTVLLRGQSANRSVVESDVSGTAGIAEIRIESPRFDTWANYFESRAYCQAVTTTDPQVTCEFASSYDPQQLYVTQQVIRIDLIN